MSLILSTILSVICSIVLITIWYLNPKWRNLHNFMSIHQIFFGTLHLCTLTLGPIEVFSEVIEHLHSLPGFVFLASFSWSLCATLVSYLRLVLLVTGKISAEKRKAAAFSYGLLIITMGITEVILPIIFRRTMGLIIEDFGPRLLSIYFLNTINIFLFICVMRSVMSCKDISVTHRRSMKIIPLIGVAILCDLITTLFLIFLLFEEFSFERIELVHTIFYYRLIPHTFVLLFNKKSKEYWKRRKLLIKLRTFQDIN